MKPISYGRQNIEEDDIQAVVEVLRSDWLTQGPAIEKFERVVADYCGARFAVAVSSGTAALHLACLSLGLGKGDIYWTSPNTFAATANCALYCGARADFVDINPKTYNLSVAALEEKLIKAKREDSLPKVVAPVHFAGQPCDMVRVKELSDSYGFSILEDGCHALGAGYAEHRIGACTHSDAVVFSFHPIKSITTGEGGMILTNQPSIAATLRRLRSHGMVRDTELPEEARQGSWYYQQVDLGFNYRLTDLQSALGISQMNRLDGFVARRYDLAQRYNSLLANLPVILPYQDSANRSAWHLYVIRLKPGECKADRRIAVETMRSAGVGVAVHYIPVHRHSYYSQMGFKAGDFPAAEEYYQTAISLPLYPGLTEDQQDYIVQKLADALQ